MSWRFRIAPLAVGALVCGSCGDRTRVAPPLETLAAPDGATVSAAWSEGTAWSLVEDLRLGSVDGDPQSTFASISSLTVDARGFLYVLDPTRYTVTVFDSEGEYAYAVGRNGDGPGEFRLPRSVVMTDGDSLMVVDHGAMRYSIFSEAGEFVRSFPRWIAGYVSSSTGHLQDDGAYVDWDVTFPDGRMGPRAEFVPIRVSTDGSQTDTFPPIEHSWTMLPKTPMPEVTFGGVVVTAALPDETFWFAHSDQYRVFRRTLTGDTIAELSAPAVPTPLTEADRDFVRNRFRRRPDLVREYLGALPEALPIISGIVPGHDDHVFVFLNAVGSEIGTAVDVFGEAGLYLGRMETPFPVGLSTVGQPPVAVATEDYLFVVRRDLLDVPYVSRLRIVRP